MNDPYRTPHPGAESPPYPAYLPPPSLPVDPPLEDVRVPGSFTTTPLVPDEVEFWKAVYVAAIVSGTRSGLERAEAADKAVLRLRKRVKR